jgi:hypothetical protein
VLSNEEHTVDKLNARLEVTPQLPLQKIVADFHACNLYGQIELFNRSRKC